MHCWYRYRITIDRVDEHMLQQGKVTHTHLQCTNYNLHNDTGTVILLVNKARICSYEDDEAYTRSLKHEHASPDSRAGLITMQMDN